MATHDLIVIGASAGGLQALRQLVSLLPADLHATLLIAQHLRPDAPSQLPDILSRSGPLPAVTAQDRQTMQPGHIYTAPADHHLLVEDGVLRVVRGPRENRNRPSIDVLFRSAAWAYGPRTVGIVLSGYLDDGALGLWAIRTCGGITVVQDPSDAMYPDMPRNAARSVDVQYSLPVTEIAPLLVTLASREVDLSHRPQPPEAIHTEVEFAKMERDMSDMNSLGVLSPFTCPSCRGALWELQNGETLSYRCHTGHAFSRESLIGDQSTAIEEALYSALRAVEEKAAALRRLSERQRDRVPRITGDYDTRARELDETAEVLRNLLAGHEASSLRQA